MTLGDILKESAMKDLSFPNKVNQLSYEEIETFSEFKIVFKSERFKEATIECEIPFSGKEEERNYARLYFLSMVFNAAIHSMKRNKHVKGRSWDSKK